MSKVQSTYFDRETINDTMNVMMMSKNLHIHFGRFDFSLEATPQLHKYYIHNWRPRIDMNLPRTVTFKWYDQRYDLPSPELLEVHAIIARIFHTSGVAERVEKALRDLEEYCGGLAKDGSTDVSSMLAATTIGSCPQSADGLEFSVPAPAASSRLVQRVQIPKKNGQRAQ